MNIVRTKFFCGATLLASVFLTACNGGGGDAAPATISYTVGGTVSGLTGTGLVLQNNGGNNLAVSAGASTFTFSTALSSGATYTVTVLTQPAGQTCTVSAHTGTVASANVTSVAVTCAANTPYSIGGTVSGLTGTGLVLQNNAGDNLSIVADGSFTFVTPVTSGSAYNVTVLSQPTGQTCTPGSNAGTVSGANVTGVLITCAAKTYTIGGAVTGLSAGKTVVLQNNGADDYLMSANSAFTFPVQVADGANYNVTVKTQPVGQTCTPSANTGTVAGANISNVVVTCSTSSYTIGGTAAGGGGVTGLNGTVVLRNNGTNDLTISANGDFVFSAPVAGGAAYAVTILTQPAGQLCTVTSGAGSNVVANITNVAVNCVNTYTIGGTITGTVSGVGPTLQNNGGDNLFIPVISTSPTNFAFSTPVPSGGTYSVTQLTRASGPIQNCVVTGGADGAGGGAVAAANVTNVVVTCTAAATVPKFAYVAESTAASAVGAADTVSAYTVGSATGALTLVGSVQTGDEPYSISVEPFGKFAYVANKGSDSISVYSINSSTGALTLIDANGSVVGTQSSIATGVGSVGDAPISVTVHPSGKFAYVVNQGNAVDTGNAITAYTIDTAGALSVMTDVDGGKIGAQTSILTGTLPYAIAVDPAGRFAYVANDASSNISAYTIDQTTGALTQVDADGAVAGIQNFAAGTNPRSVAIDPAGKCALVANGGSDNVKSYTINATTGALANVSSVISRSAGSAPRSVAIDPATGMFAYVANAGGNTVVAASWATGTATFTTNAAHGYKTGDVIHVSNVVTATGYNGTFTILAVPSTTTFTVGIASNPGTWVSGGTIAEGSVSAFSLDPNTCAITLMDTFTAGTTPFSISIDPSGKYVYVANFGSNNISAYSIDNSGALTALAGSPFTAGLGPVSVTTAQ